MSGHTFDALFVFGGAFAMAWVIWRFHLFTTGVRTHWKQTRVQAPKAPAAPVVHLADHRPRHTALGEVISGAKAQQIHQAVKRGQGRAS